MDTYSLYSAGIDAGIDFCNSDHERDCLDIWVIACIANTEFMTEYLGDFLTELTTPAIIAEIACRASSALEDVNFLHRDARRSVGITTAYAQSLDAHCSVLGMWMLKAIEKETRKVVDNNLSLWFADCVGYHHDMLSGLREDAQERRADR